MILEKIIEDPQSGSCTGISYTDGPILPQSSVASLFATNLTNSLHLPVTGHPAMDSLKFILRAKGYNEAATREVTAAMYTLASYGFIHLRTPPIPTMPTHEWPASSAEALAAAASYYAQASAEAANAASAAANTGNQTQEQSNYSNYYNSFYNNSGNYGNNGYNAGGGSYDNNSYGGNANYNSYGNSGMQQSGNQDSSGYSSGMGGQGNYSAGSGAAFSASSSTGGNYPGNMGSGGYQGGMGEFGAQGSGGGPPAPPNNNASMGGRQEVDVTENVLQAIMGAEGKGMMEIQQWCGVTIEVVQKAQFMHTVKIMGPPNSVQSALYIVQQYVQHAEYKRYYEGQGGQQQHPGPHQTHQ